MGKTSQDMLAWSLRQVHPQSCSTANIRMLAKAHSKFIPRVPLMEVWEYVFGLDGKDPPPAFTEWEPYVQWLSMRAGLCGHRGQTLIFKPNWPVMGVYDFQRSRGHWFLVMKCKKKWAELPLNDPMGTAELRIVNNFSERRASVVCRNFPGMQRPCSEFLLAQGRPMPDDVCALEDAAGQRRFGIFSMTPGALQDGGGSHLGGASQSMAPLTDGVRCMSADTSSVTVEETSTIGGSPAPSIRQDDLATLPAMSLATRMDSTVAASLETPDMIDRLAPPIPLSLASSVGSDAGAADPAEAPAADSTEVPEAPAEEPAEEVERIGGMATPGDETIDSSGA